MDEYEIKLEWGFTDDVLAELPDLHDRVWPRPERAPIPITGDIIQFAFLPTDTPLKVVQRSFLLSEAGTVVSLLLDWASPNGHP